MTVSPRTPASHQISPRIGLALVVTVLVTAITVRSQVPVGAGVYYDDGAYLALGRALAEGEGYRYSNLPQPIPGVKYPPAYPLLLAAAWRTAGSYPENLSLLKSLNALLSGCAAGLTFLLFARGGRGRVAAAAIVSLFGFLTVPTLSLSTVLLSEPLFLVAAGGALLAAGAVQRSAAEASEGAGPAPRRDLLAAAAGLLAGATFLTRTAGLTLIAAILCGLALRRRWRLAGIAALAALAVSLPWLLWSAAHAGEVPAAIVGQYGTYGAWLGQSRGGTLLAWLSRAGEIAAANWPPLIETLEFVWVPRAPAPASAFVLLLLAAAAGFGAWRVGRRNLPLALFPPAYLALVFVWPYEPYRFLYAILPLLTLFVVEGLFEAIPRFRRDFPRWGVPAAGVALAVIAVNAIEYHVRGHVKRSWASPQTIPATAYAPLNQWLRRNTAPDEVIASGLDPYVHWETGRPAVPSWRFLPDDYGRYDRTPEVLAAGLDSILSRFRPRYVALILGANKAAATLEAFAELHPDRATQVFASPDTTFSGVIYRVAPPGESLPAPAVPLTPPNRR